MSTHVRLPVSVRNFAVGWEIEAKEFTGSYPDPTSLPLAFSLTAAGPGAYAAGYWQTDPSTDPDTRWAVLDVSGPGVGGANEYPAGTYRVWVRIIDGTRTAVLEVGQLTLY